MVAVVCFHCIQASQTVPVSESLGIRQLSYYTTTMYSSLLFQAACLKADDCNVVVVDEVVVWLTEHFPILDPPDMNGM